MTESGTVTASPCTFPPASFTANRTPSMIPREFVPVRSTTSTAIWIGAECGGGVGRGGVAGGFVAGAEEVATLGDVNGSELGPTAGEEVAKPPAWAGDCVGPPPTSPLPPRRRPAPMPPTRAATDRPADCEFGPGWIAIEPALMARELAPQEPVPPDPPDPPEPP